MSKNNSRMKENCLAYSTTNGIGGSDARCPLCNTHLFLPSTGGFIQGEPSDVRAPQVHGHPELLDNEAPVTIVSLGFSHPFLPASGTILKDTLSVVALQIGPMSSATLA
jgi:hypothetical protein